MSADLMGCGHPVSAVVSSGEGTSYCGECVREAQPDSGALLAQAIAATRGHGIGWRRDAYAELDRLLAAERQVAALEVVAEAAQGLDDLNPTLSAFMHDEIWGMAARKLHTALDSLAAQDSGGERAPADATPFAQPKMQSPGSGGDAR